MTDNHDIKKQKNTKRIPPPALDPDAREKQMIALSEDLAEQRIRDGSASSQLLIHYLKLGSSRERVEKERLKNENELLKAKVKDLESSRRTEQLFEEALKVFGIYKGEQEPEEYEDQDDYRY